MIGDRGEQLLRSVSPLTDEPPAEPFIAVVGSEPKDALALHRLARELGVDFSAVKGTGHEDEVTEDFNPKRCPFCLKTDLPPGPSPCEQ